MVQQPGTISGEDALAHRPADGVGSLQADILVVVAAAEAGGQDGAAGAPSRCRCPRWAGCR